MNHPICIILSYAIRFIYFFNLIESDQMCESQYVYTTLLLFLCRFSHHVICIFIPFVEETISNQSFRLSDGCASWLCHQMRQLLSLQPLSNRTDNTWSPSIRCVIVWDPVKSCVISTLMSNINCKVYLATGCWSVCLVGFGQANG